MAPQNDDIPFTGYNKDGWTWLKGADFSGKEIPLCPQGNYHKIGQHLIGILSGKDNSLVTRSFWDINNFKKENKNFNQNQYTYIGYVRTVVPFLDRQRGVPFSVLSSLSSREVYQIPASLKSFEKFSGGRAGVDFMAPGMARVVMGAMIQPPFYALNYCTLKDITDVNALTQPGCPLGSLWCGDLKHRKSAPSLFGCIDLSSITGEDIYNYLNDQNPDITDSTSVDSGTISQIVLNYVKEYWKDITDNEITQARFIGRYLVMSIDDPEEFNPQVCALWKVDGGKLKISIWILDWYDWRDIERLATSRLIKALEGYWFLPVFSPKGLGKGSPPPLGLEDEQLILRIRIIDSVVGRTTRSNRRDNEIISNGSFDCKIIDGYSTEIDIRYDLVSRSLFYNPTMNFSIMKQGDENYSFTKGAISRYEQVIIDNTINFDVDTTNFELVGAPGLYPQLP